MNSPFTYDKISNYENFLGRDKELKKIKDIVKHSNNLLIHSKRRMGKTTLINHFMKQNENDYICIFVDIFDITSKEDFALALIKALSNSQKGELKSIIKRLTSLFKRVRIEPTIDPNTLEYSIKPIVTTLSFDEMIEDFFHTLNELSKKSKIILAIDEFQQIANITDVKLDAILRKYIQNRENISYIFLGSKRHLLTSLFEYKAPLYELANHFELQGLKEEDLYNYSKKHLDVSYEMINHIYKICDSETKLIQHILHLLFLQKNLKVTKELIFEVLTEIINSKDASYRLIYDTLNNNQKIALKVVGIYKQGFFANDILNKYNIKKQTLQSALNSLFKRELIDKNCDKYFIPDRTLELWVERVL